MDILLINSFDFSWTTENPYPSLGQMVLRDILKECFEVEYVDFKLMDKMDELKLNDNTSENVKICAEYIVNKKPKVVGFYTICHSFVFSVQLAKYVKELDKSITIVYGGPHATLTASDCMSSLDFVDVICLGESELSIMPLMEALINGRDMALVPGIVYKSHGEIITNPRAELIGNEELGKYTVFDYSPYSFKPEDTVSLEGGRGCPFGCTFCSTNSFWGNKFRIKPIDVLIDEMKKFNQLYGVKRFSIVHDLFTANRKYIAEFCHRLIDEKLDFEWGCSSRVDVLDKELLDLMKESKCIGIFLGIETGSNRMQKIVNKNLKLDNALEIIRHIKKIGISQTVSFIYCYPDETIEDFLDTLKMIESIYYIDIRNIQLHRFMVLPSTDETIKVRGRLYFEKTSIELSLFNDRLFDDECIKWIEEYPDIFVQYYTFDSTVKSKYKRADTMMFSINLISLYCKISMEYLIKTYGLSRLYLKYEGDFENLYYKLNSSAAPRRSNLIELTKVYSVISQILLREEEELQALGFSQISKYERLMAEYVVEQKTEPEVHEFEVDIEELKMTGICTLKKYYVRYSNKDGRVIATKLSPLYGLAKNTQLLPIAE